MKVCISNKEVLVMFLDELSPLFQGMIEKPVAFVGGFVSGMLRLNLADDPVKGWLDKEMVNIDIGETSNPFDSRANGNGPQSITIE